MLTPNQNSTTEQVLLPHRVRSRPPSEAKKHAHEKLAASLEAAIAQSKKEIESKSQFRAKRLQTKASVAWRKKLRAVDVLGIGRVVAAKPCIMFLATVSNWLAIAHSHHVRIHAADMFKCSSWKESHERPGTSNGGHRDASRCDASRRWPGKPHRGLNRSQLARGPCNACILVRCLVTSNYIASCYY